MYPVKTEFGDLINNEIRRVRTAWGKGQRQKKQKIKVVR